MRGGKRRVLVAYGTRPEAIKLAPVVREISRSPWLEPVVAVSGQHREMLDQVNELFGITPDIDLDIIAPGQTLTQVTNRALDGYSNYVAAGEFDAAIVQGDTTTAFAAALAAFYAQTHVVHVEAGLRTGHMYSPFPEEINRRLISQMATLHLAPTGMSRDNLLAEGVDAGDITVTGNTVIDALTHAAGLRRPIGNVEVDGAISAGRPILLVTAHRRESWDTGLAAIGNAVAAVARAHPEVLVAVPVHANPIVRERLLPPMEGIPNVEVLEPLSYGPFSHLLSRSAVVLTDSGGIQEEAPTFGVPVLVTRNTTERPEAVQAGTARLVGTQSGGIFSAVSRALSRPAAGARSADGAAAMAPANPFGDGKAAVRTRAAVEALFGVGQRRPEFTLPEPVLAEAYAS
ncbi:non-hydrolyzing UDP-N-acetylglucosamine 2-epimerase [Phytoactinopolyspora limicola]|uniref:non-hydrolyzing UDP-N-acetylglucosamine 2-epimerase n=1 Tax=Phytoactinopolyspora limicola TaxID=2715536 RepID=UPI0014084000|nr:UDP-N-acetylglucosamine 2-epimerase (non-hydrolyzing) [Phytoactinopolyspora limicola]